MCCSNNISRLLSPAVMRGSANFFVSKGQVRLECCLRSGVPSFPGRPPLNSVAQHWTSHSLVPVQSAFQPTYDGRHVGNVLRAILKPERTDKRAVRLIFRPPLSHLFTSFLHILRSFIPPRSPRSSCVVTDVRLSQRPRRSDLQVTTLFRSFVEGLLQWLGLCLERG